MASECKAKYDADCDKPLSIRASRVVNQGSGIFGRINEEAKDAFHPVDNPRGKVNFGIAENNLCQEMIWTRMQEIAKMPEPLSTFTYGVPMDGDLQFRQTLQRFLTRHFNPLKPIDSQHLFVIHGMTLAIESMAMALCEAGDYMMVMSPHYYRGKTDMWERAGVDIVPVPTLFPNENDDGYTCDLRDNVLEDCYQTAKQQGKRIRAICFVNPTNPTGDMYTQTQIETLLKFAHRHELHIIANEIYGLTVFDVEKKHISLLSVPWPDPGRVHFCWAFSKDFGLSGYHCAVLYTHNPSFQQYNRIINYYTNTDELVQLRLKALLDDEDWIDHTWLPTLKSRLRERFEGVKELMTSVGVGVHKSSASLFAWLDMRKFLTSPTEKGEELLLEQFMQGGVLIMPGTSTRAVAPGFFRMVISLDESQHQEGMKRLMAIFSKLNVQ